MTADCGDYVVVSNARKVKVTGKKAEQLIYRHHTMFPGGLKEIQYKDMMHRKPDEVRLPVDILLISFFSIFHYPPFSSFMLYIYFRLHRSFAKQSLACYPKTSYGIGGWRGCGYSKGRISGRSSIIS